MNPGSQIRFGPFHLDLDNEQLWKGAEELALAPKAWAMLRYLVEREARLVTKEELLDAVWPEVTVGDAVLKTSIAEIRRALGDEPQAPRFIETVHRRGYRFIARVMSDGTEAGHPPIEETAPEPVEREAELAALERFLRLALGGKRQLVFVTGEPGIGKSTLLSAFVGRVRRRQEIWIARGQCLAHFAAGEPYQPVLEAIGQLGREHGRIVVDLLGRFAPTWLAELPSLVDPRARRDLEREARGAGPERMLREMAEAIEALGERTPLLLVLEDLHSSDRATIDLLSSLAHRAAPARLLLLASYRPVEVTVQDHPLKTLKHELGAHGRCQEIELDCLSVRGVAEMIARRFPGDGVPGELARLVCARTDGNPLFVVNVLDYLVAQGAIAEQDGAWQLVPPVAEVEIGVPDTVREMLERHVDRLEERDRRILEAGAVAGVEFSAAEVAAALGEEAIAVEERCAALARRRQFVAPGGPTVAKESRATERFRFTHALYPVVLRERVPVARRRDLHRRIGEHAEKVLGEDRARELAVPLARHFEEGRGYARAGWYLRLAAQNASRRHAHREAEACYARALECADRCPQSEREELRAEIRRERGLARRAVGDMLGAAEDFDAVIAAAQAAGRLRERVGAMLELASALMWYDRGRWQSVLEEVRGIADEVDDPWLATHALGVCAECSLELGGWRAEDFAACERAVVAARERGNRALLGLHLANYAYFQLHHSDYPEAFRTAEEGHEIAVEVGEAYADFTCLSMQNLALLGLGEWGAMSRAVREGVAKAERNGQTFAGHMLRLNEGSLSIEAFACGRARSLAESALQGFRAAFFLYGELFARIVLGRAEIGCGRTDEGIMCLTEAAELAPIVMLDWFFHMPLQQGLAEGWLEKRDLERARRHAGELVERATRGPERSFVAIGHDLNARIALAAGDRRLAKREIDAALEALGERKLPVAGWRIFETAARIAEQDGRAKALPFWKRSAAILRSLADSLGEEAELQRSLLGAKRVRQIFRAAGLARVDREAPVARRVR